MFLGHFRKHFRNFGGTIFKTPLQCFEKNQIFDMIKINKKGLYGHLKHLFTAIYENIFKIL